MMTTADIGFCTELPLERRLVWEGLFALRFNFAKYFLLCKTFKFSHFKVQIGLCYQTTHSWITWHYFLSFSNKNSELEVYFRNFFHWAFSQISIWTLFNSLFTKNVLFRRLNSLKCPCPQTPCFSNPFMTGEQLFRLISSETGKVNIYRLKVKHEKKQIANWVIEF